VGDLRFLSFESISKSIDGNGEITNPYRRTATEDQFNPLGKKSEERGERIGPRVEEAAREGEPLA